jgi:hypothetical protein
MKIFKKNFDISNDNKKQISKNKFPHHMLEEVGGIRADIGAKMGSDSELT